MIPRGSGGKRALARTLAVVFLALLPGVARAQPPAPPPPGNFFTDKTGVVRADLAAQLEQRLRDFQTASSNQIVVVVADRIPEGYASLEEYTNRTAEAWRVGDKARDNGVVLFVFVADRKVRMEVGYGLEGALPDALASRIINDEIAPRFRRGEYGDGVAAGVDAIIRATKGEYRPFPARSTSGRTALIVVMTLLLLLAVVLFLFREIEDRGYSRTYSGRGWSGGGRRWGSGGGRGGFAGGGGGSWGGGGFSGGGGSFGGGGASGSW